MSTLFYVGRPYPHAEALIELRALGYNIGLLQDTTYNIKHPELFDTIIPIDFQSIDGLPGQISTLKGSGQIDGLLCLYENYIPHKAVIAAALDLPSISLESALACTDKYAMRTMFMAQDPSITPRFDYVESTQQLLDFAHEVGYPLMLKPTNLVKSLLVSKCNNETELLAAYDSTKREINNIYIRQGVTDRDPRIIVEQFIEGNMCSVAAYVDHLGTAHFCDGIAELTTAQNIGYDDNFLYRRALSDTFNPATKQRIFGVAKSGIEALGMRSSPAHVEIIYNSDHVQIVEIGARTGGYRPFLYAQSYGLNLLQQEARLATGQLPELYASFTQHVAMYELFPHTQSKFVTVRGLAPLGEYTYTHIVAKPGTTVGPAKLGYKAAAILAVADTDRAAFEHKSHEVESLEIVTS